MKIFHMDLDENLRKLLHVTKLYTNNDVECITCKSQSVLSSEVLKFFPNLKLIVARTVGIDNIDLKYCKSHKIAVYNIPNYGSQEVAEHALALTLAGARHIVSANHETHLGKFDYKPFLGTSIVGKTIGVVGTGNIGLAYIQLLSSFGVTILAYDVVKQKNVTYVSLEELLTKSDIVSLHVPLLPTTRHMISGKELRMMKKGSILVNTSRGAIIDEQALIKYVHKFFAVCLDIVENEATFSKKHPLLQFNNVIITPHIGFYTDDSIKKIAIETETSIMNYKHDTKEGRIV